MDTPRPLGLYIHIPFCRSKCAYCDFYSLAGSEERMDAYVFALTNAIRTAAPLAKDYRADTVYFGGGTPSLLGTRRLAALLETVADGFDLDGGAEITLEANPESARGVEGLRTLRRAGFNRVSLGMQSADDAELRRIGRVHCARDTAEAVDSIRRAGFENLSLDLIYGLPSQTRRRWLDNLRAAVALAPEHISCYALKIEPGTPLAASMDTLDVPDGDTQADMYLDAVGLLAAEGFEQYEISNFARSGRCSEHNLKYWTLGEYLGFGPGAHSDFGARRFAAARDLDAFIRGAAALSEDAEISPREREAERVMLGLRLARGLPESVLAGAERVLEGCAAHGLARLEGGYWSLTPQGMLVSNEIILRVQEALGL
ncbi:MAG: radical SAM family heme chaperone HemW [Oscillospiraceae bacterium]|nr:radical SAM family heme chaperone HemW [Oscillospiraceae bacterium]